MNRITKFFHEFLNPHCEHCMEKERDEKVCDSCETLKSQIARLQFENDKLLDRILEKPKEVEVKVDTSELKPITPRGALNWRVKQQMLEAEDRERAKLLKNAPIPTEELEKELDVAEQSRESAKA